MSLKRRRKSAEPPLAGLRTDHGMHWAIWRRLASFGIASLARQRGPARMLAIEAPVTAVLSGLRAAADEHRHQGGRHYLRCGHMLWVDQVGGRPPGGRLRGVSEA
jgi:hypothetical protein